MGWKESLLGVSGTDATSAEQKEQSEQDKAMPDTDTKHESALASNKNKGEGQLSVDVYETHEAIVILAPIAGVRREDIKITVTDDVLEIKGFRSRKEEIKKEQFYSRECFWGAFSRSIVLPASVKPNQVRANLTGGILKITVPKAHLTQAQEVPIIEEGTQAGT